MLLGTRPRQSDLVENVRETGRTEQRIVANLGRKEVVVARSDLDRLARSVARLAPRSIVLSLVEGRGPATNSSRLPYRRPYGL